MPKSKSEKIIAVEQKLGKLSYALSVQAEIVDRETKKFQELRKQGDKLTTERKKLDG